jgi:hypothetical protein
MVWGRFQKKAVLRRKVHLDQIYFSVSSIIALQRRIFDMRLTQFAAVKVTICLIKAAPPFDRLIGVAERHPLYQQ